MMSRYVAIDVEEVLHETPAAFLFCIDGTEVWVPKSVMEQEDQGGAGMSQLYIYRWGKYRPEWKGRVCRVISRGTMNSALIQFVDDNVKAVVSRNALRKVKP